MNPFNELTYSVEFVVLLLTVVEAEDGLVVMLKSVTPRTTVDV